VIQQAIAAETGHVIRQVIVATPKASCDGAMAVVLVFGCGAIHGDSYKGSGRLMELDSKLCDFSLTFGL
jgi:hypothetical protein